MIQVQINNKNDTVMVNTKSGHQDQATRSLNLSEEKKNSQSTTRLGKIHDLRVNFGKLRPPLAIYHERKLVNPRLQNHNVWWVSTLGLHNP